MPSNNTKSSEPGADYLHDINLSSMSGVLHRSAASQVYPGCRWTCRFTRGV